MRPKLICPKVAVEFPYPCGEKAPSTLPKGEEALLKRATWNYAAA